MKIEVTLPDFDSRKEIEYNWQEGFEIDIQVTDTGVMIKANSAGLSSLASHFLNLAQEKIPTGHHIHFDAYNSLEHGSIDLTIEKV